MTFQDARNKLMADGFVVIRDFFSSIEIAEVKKDIENWVSKDLAERQAAGAPEGHFEGSVGITHLNTGKHILTDFFAKSPKLDQLSENLLTDATVSQLLTFIGGKNLKLRGYNVRQMTGAREYSAMEWHCDNIGEITIGIVIDKSGPENDAVTCFIPGSHHYPYCPFNAVSFDMPYPNKVLPRRKRFFSALLAKKTIEKDVFDATGNPGDIYIFVGDVWHARRPNLNGNKGAVFFIGLFPTEIPFPPHSKVVIPGGDVLSNLPPKLRSLVDFKNTPPNHDRSSYLHVLAKSKMSPSRLSLWRLARFERKAWEYIDREWESPKFRIPRMIVAKIKGAFRRIGYQLKLNFFARPVKALRILKLIPGK